MQTNTQPLTLDSVPVLQWEADTRPHIERTTRWYIAATIIVVLAAAYGIFTGSWSFAIVSVLAGGMYVLVHDHKPPRATIELHDIGVKLGEEFTRWDELAGYWFLKTREYTELHLTRKRRGDLVIQTNGTDLESLRTVLSQRIPELTQKHENLIDACIRLSKL